MTGLRFAATGALLLALAGCVNMVARSIADGRAAEFNRHDVAALMSQYSSDAVLVTSDGQRIEGKPAIEAYVRAMFAAFPDLHMEVVDVDTAAIDGGYRTVAGFKFVAEGKSSRLDMVSLTRGEDGGYFTYQQTWNSTSPLLAEATRRIAAQRSAAGGMPPSAAAPVPPAAATKFLAAQPQPAAYALIVGIERYRDAPAAIGARRDAERFAELAKTTLGVRPDNLRVVIDDRATHGDIKKSLDWLKANVPSNGRIYFFYSGHGAPDAAQGTPYLLPYDGDAKFVDQTAMPLAEVMQTLGASRAKEVLAVVDSCFSGAGGRSVLPEGARPLVKVREAVPVAHVTLFSAASGAEISGPAEGNDGGLFSKYVAEGIGTGAADIDGDGTITLRELADWVGPRVAREAKRANRDQNPGLSAPAGDDPKAFAVAYGLVK